MERLCGIIVRHDLPPGLELGPAGVRALFERVVEVHAELHAVDWRAAGLEGFGRPEGYVPRQIAGWSERYRQARTPDVPDFAEVIAWLEQHLPQESGRAAIIHKISGSTALLDPADPLRVIGVLDWGSRPSAA
jgi:aminoglycoside phosphotransferase (APT) family kinase protein